MRLRVFQSWTWVKALAVLGVLMHAGLLARHTVQAGTTGVRAILTDAGYCDASSVAAGQEQAPHAPWHGVSCPICTGAMAAPALLPKPAIILDISRQWLPSGHGFTTARHGYGTGMAPPNRGPPLASSDGA
jgi:hypothetical protein